MIGPDGKIRNKVRRVFKDTVNKEEESQIVKFCNRDVIKGSHKTLETLVELEEIEVLESSTEGGQVQVLQVYRTLGPDGIVRNRVRRIIKEEGTKKNTNVATKESDQMVQFHNVVGADDASQVHGIYQIEESGDALLLFNIKDILPYPFGAKV